MAAPRWRSGPPWRTGRWFSMFAFYAPVIYLGAVNAWAGVVVKDLFAQVGDRRGLKLASTPSPS